MGLAAGQARLLSITARLTDNEQNGQALSFAKQRLADETDQINKAYNEALSATKLTVLTGFNGSEPNYEDISYGLMTGYNTVAAGKQYVVTDAKGKILVNDKLAKAFADGNGDFNYFLAHVDDVSSGQTVNYSQCDLDLTNRQSEANIKAVHDAWDKYMTSVGLSFIDKEHDYSNDDISFGWKTGTYDVELTMPRYLVGGSNGFISTMTKNAEPYPYVQLNKVYAEGIKTAIFENGKDGGVIRIPDLPECKYTMYQGADKDGNPETIENTLGETVPVYYFEACDNDNKPQLYKIFKGNSTYFSYRYDESTNDWDHYFDMSIADRFITNVTTTSGVTHCTTNYIYPLNYEGTTQEQRELYDYAVAITKEVYRDNEFSNAISPQENKLKTVADDPEVASKIQYYKNIFNQMAKFGYTTASEMNIPTNGLNKALGTGSGKLKDNNWFEQFLRQGKLQLKAYDATQRDFITTTLDQDSSIQEVADERKIAKAEAEFVQAQDALERKDKKIDLELKKLDTEHNALQTEYESLKEVVKKNVEKSFNLFS